MVSNLDKIYSFHIFDRHCNCIFYTSWNQTDQKDLELVKEDSKLVYGVAFSLRNIITKLNPDKKRYFDITSESFLVYRTNAYKLHYLETATSVKFVLMTDHSTPNLRKEMEEIYRVYVNYVSKNAMISFDSAINNDLFRSQLQRYIRTLDCFESNP